MDYWGEAVALTIDAIIFGLCYKVYYKYQQDIIRIQVSLHLQEENDILKIFFVNSVCGSRKLNCSCV